MGPRWIGRLAVGVAVAAFTGCDAGGTVGLATGAPLPTAGGAPVSSAVVGTWARTVAFTDNFGGISTSETVWTFAPSAAATRFVVARNVTAGIADTVITRGAWSTAGDRLEFRFAAPLSGSVSFRYRVTTDTLHLDDRAFARR